MNRMMVTAVVLAVAGLFGASRTATAQHATANDIEDGSRRYQTACATCHGPDGDLIAGIDFGRGRFRRPLTDAELAAIIVNGIPNTPMPASGMSMEQALRVVTYVRSMGTRPARIEEGGEARGAALFAGKGGCTACHRVGTQGSRTGPNLSAIGLLRRAVELERSLLEPDSEVQPQNRYYTVTPRRGEPIAGRLLNHDTFTIQLIDGDGRLRSFAKADLAAHGFERTPMPSVGDALSAAEIADLVAYLVSLKGVKVQ